MSMARIMPVAVVLAVGLGAATASLGQTLRREPPMGKLREGERVLVDDGRCPSGQIMEVIGGNHVKVGGNKHIERTRRCIARR
jgi:hypothetical protein